MDVITRAITNANVMTVGHFVLADGQHTQLKLEMDNLWTSAAELTVVLDLLGQANGLPLADVIMGVPTGGQRLAQALVTSGRVTTPLIELQRIPGGGKRDFMFASAHDARVAARAKSVRIYEDVVTSLSSVAGVVKLLAPKSQTVHSLAIWRRGQVKPIYQRGISDHYLVQKRIPSYEADNCPTCTNPAIR